MTERELKALEEALELILLRHSGYERQAVAELMVDTVVEVYRKTEEDIIQ